MNISEKTLRKILKEQKTTPEILLELKENGVNISGREWRRYVRSYNDSFVEHDRYIASDNKGYYMTTNKKAIARTTMNKFKNAHSMMINAKRDFRSLSEKDQLSIFDTDPDIYDMLLKMR